MHGAKELKNTILEHQFFSSLKFVRKKFEQSELIIALIDNLLLIVKSFPFIMEKNNDFIIFVPSMFEYILRFLTSVGFVKSGKWQASKPQRVVHRGSKGR